ncbi:DUF397 domain-containing protein [Streptomyces sp. NPDC050315]|uniref:DUF397 domain-containing protein n=1 Tax=Streptomyces sp. NPDC050315 TaxID=3155039 RepID=UPI00343F6DE1
MSTELVWFKSSYSGTNGGDCVEVAAAPGTDTVHIRDSKAIGGPELRVSGGSWRGLISYVTAEGC